MTNPTSLIAEALALATDNACAYLANEPEVYLALREASGAAQAELRRLFAEVESLGFRLDVMENGSP